MGWDEMGFNIKWIWAGMDPIIISRRDILMLYGWDGIGFACIDRA
jgi:hypothetical protein